MRLSTISVWLFYLAGRVVADINATPYQMVYLWYAYILDGQAGGHIIAPCCSNCDLDTFIKHVQNPGQKSGPWKGATGLTGPWVGQGALTVDDIADAIKKNGFHGFTDAIKFIPGMISSESPAKIFSDLYDKINDHVQNLRVGLTGIDEHVSRMTTALEEAKDHRITSLTVSAVDIVNTFSKRKGWGIRAVASLTNPRYLDSYRTLATNPNHSFQCKTFVQGYASGIVSKSGLNSIMNFRIGAANSHLKAIGTIESMINDMSLPVQCVKPKKLGARRRRMRSRWSVEPRVRTSS
ncbi:hypothetical protein GE09DRAFT_289739 [Coniochaeta sp. 2T2.1]|nr:hypothetical protein GE09DRAFT_289739 [Coniochaeta sp. 2T2.1]